MLSFAPLFPSPKSPVHMVGVRQRIEEHAGHAIKGVGERTVPNPRGAECVERHGRAVLGGDVVSAESGQRAPEAVTSHIEAVRPGLACDSLTVRVAVSV